MTKEKERINTEAIREKTSILALVQNDGHKLTEHKDGYYYGACPFCQEGDDRFKVFNNDGDEFFYCRRCEKQGDIIEYVRLKHHLDFPNACRWLDAANVPELEKSNATIRQNGSKDALNGESWLDWQVRLDLLATEAIRHILEQRSDGATAALDWLKARGIRGEDVANFGIGYNPTWKQITPGYKLPPGITLPRWCDQANLVAVNVYLAKEARQNGDKRRYVKGSQPKRCLYNQLRIADAETVVICEGELDAVLLSRFLPPHAIAVATGGASMHPDNLDILDGKRIVLALDNDNAGHKATVKWIERLKEAKGESDIAQIITPQKDITDYWRASGDLAQWVGTVLA